MIQVALHSLFHEMSMYWCLLTSDTTLFKIRYNDTPFVILVHRSTYLINYVNTLSLQPNREHNQTGCFSGEKN